MFCCRANELCQQHFYKIDNDADNIYVEDHFRKRTMMTKDDNNDKNEKNNKHDKDDKMV